MTSMVFCEMLVTNADSTFDPEFSHRFRRERGVLVRVKICEAQQTSGSKRTFRYTELTVRSCLSVQARTSRYSSRSIRPFSTALIAEDQVKLMANIIRRCCAVGLAIAKAA